MVGGSRGLWSLVLSCAVTGFGVGGCTLGSDDGDSETDAGSTGGVSVSASSGSSEGTDGGSDSETGASSTGGTTDDSESGGSTDGGTTGTSDPSTTDGTASTSTSTSEGTSTGGMSGYCEPTNDWMGAWSTLEEEVLVLVNERRSEGANCGSEGSFGPTGPLTMQPLLRCAARLHSKDMVDRDFFDHTNPDGESPWDRMDKAGYGGYSNAGENIAAGSATAAGVVDQWMGSDGHCSNIMSPDFEEIGVGYYPGGDFGHVWTQVFAKK
jgi:uncharacterized protein YkwD